MYGNLWPTLELRIFSCQSLRVCDKSYENSTQANLSFGFATKTCYIKRL